MQRTAANRHLPYAVAPHPSTRFENPGMHAASTRRSHAPLLNLEYRCIEATNLNLRRAMRSSTRSSSSVLPPNCCTTSWVFPAVEQFDRLGVVHHTRDCVVERLRTQGSPNTRSQGEFVGSALEADAVERQIVHL